MTADAVTAVDLARRLKVDPKRFRGWLREKARTGHPLLRAHQHRDSWIFTRQEAERLAAEFRVSTTRTAASSWPPAGPASPAALGPTVEVATPSATHTSTVAASPSATEVIATLTSAAPRPASALVRADLPAASGLYAWWIPPNVMPSLQRDGAEALSVRKDLLLLYVGISSDLRQRLWRNHINGNTRGSTLRRTLASLVTPSDLAGTGGATTATAAWTAESEMALTRWIKAHLCMTWAVHPMPKAVEADVIGTMRPPCNLDHNVGHPNHASLSAARTTWRSGQSR